MAWKEWPWLKRNVGRSIGRPNYRNAIQWRQCWTWYKQYNTIHVDLTLFASKHFFPNDWTHLNTTALITQESMEHPHWITAWTISEPILTTDQEEVESSPHTFSVDRAIVFITIVYEITSPWSDYHHPLASSSIVCFFTQVFALFVSRSSTVSIHQNMLSSTSMLIWGAQKLFMPFAAQSWLLKTLRKKHLKHTVKSR